MTDLTAETIVDLTIPEDVHLSPDGSVAVFVVAPVGQPGEHPASALWTVRAEGDEPARKLTAGAHQDCSPRWSDNGDTVYFRSDRIEPGVFQVYRIALDGGEAEALTMWEPGIAAAIPMPGDTSLALLAVDVKSDDDKQREKQRDDAEVYGERWPIARLRLLDLASRQITTLASTGDRHVVEAAPAPDGTRIALIAWPNPELDNMTERGELLIVDSAADKVIPVATLTSGGGDLGWGPDARTLLFSAHLAPGLRGGQGVFAVDVDADANVDVDVDVDADVLSTVSEPRPFAHDLPVCPAELATNATGAPLVLMQERLDSWIGKLDLDTGRLDRVAELPGDVLSFSVSANGRTIAAIGSRRDSLPEIWIKTNGGEFPQRTRLNPVTASISFGNQEPVNWRAPDDLEIDGLLILPPGATRADGPFPLITLVHGGPYARYADALHLGWGRWGQWLATAGYAILLPNPRGGSGRGHDFANRVAGAVGREDWADVESGIDALIELGVADPERLGIGGWSQGGFMTAWAIGQTTRFKVGIMGAGVSNWGMMAATRDLPSFEAMLGGSNAWDGPGPHRHDALSPISFAALATTPTLILHGAEDARVPVSQGRFFARALREHGAPCELVVYPREKHPIREREHQLDLLRRVQSWVERWLGPGWTQPANSETPT